MPPTGGRKTSRSGRVTSSGNMPPVSSNKVRRRSGSATPNRRARPGKCQTGSIAALVTRISPSASNTAPSALRIPSARSDRSSGSMIRAVVTAMVGRASIPARIRSAKTSPTSVAPRVERDDLGRVAPLRTNGNRGCGPGAGQVGSVIARQRPGGDRQRPVDRVGAGISADRIALPRLGRAGHDRTAGRRSGRPPPQRDAALAAGAPGGT